MKCQNCGKNEINFYYSSNVNGCVTETHLCSECASKTGYDPGRMFDTESILRSFFPVGMRSSFLPIPMFGFALASPLRSWPRIGSKSAECSCGGSCETSEREEKQTTQVDAEMQKRREICAVREQMRIAAEKEDFEKAAELRDQLRIMEAE